MAKKSLQRYLAKIGKKFDIRGDALITAIRNVPIIVPRCALFLFYTINVTAQLEKMAHCAFTDFFAEPPVRLAEKLKQLTGYDRVFFSNSGTESVEAAIKLAMWKLHRPSLLGFYGAFHGRTLGSLSLTCSTVKHKEHFPTIRAVHAHYGYCYRCPLHLEYPGCGIESYRYVHGNGKLRRKG